LTAQAASLVFVGGLMLDSIAAVSRFPGADERVLADQIVQAGGGPASTAAVAAARLGVPDVAFAGTVGRDGVGARLIDELVAEGIDVSGVTGLPGVTTGASVIVVDLAAGSRSISALPGPGVQLNEAAVALIRGARWVHVDHIGWPALSGLIGPLDANDARSPLRPAVSVDISYDVPGFHPAGADLYAPNIQALARRYAPGELEPGEENIDRLLELALGDGARRVVVTRGSAGSNVATADGLRGRIPAHRADINSTLGAGDVFHGALLAAVDRGEDLMSAMQYAGVVAALSCRGLDGRSAIPSHEETLTELTTTVT